MEIHPIEDAAALWPVQDSRSMLIVEDEALICMVIEDFATDLGWNVVGVAHSEAAALKLLEEITPTIAVLDINLGSTNSFSIARLCQERGIAVLFTTGYTQMPIPEGCGT